MINFWGRKLSVQKANLHTHCQTSDGKYSQSEIIRLYHKAAYEVLAFTDHRQTNPVAKLDGQGMTLLSGIELHPVGPRGIRWHIVALGVPENFEYNPDDPPLMMINRVNEVGGVCFAAHPYWCGFTASEVMSLKGIIGLEVYNTSTRYIGKAYNMQLWDEILDAGQRCYACAVDDTHREQDLFRGWTMIACSEHDPDSIIQALKNGQFYASQGPEFKSLSFENGILKAEFTLCRDAVVMTNKSGGYGLVDGNYSSIECDTTDWEGSYLRLQICDHQGNYAWSNPVYL